MISGGPSSSTPSAPDREADNPALASAGSRPRVTSPAGPPDWLPACGEDRLNRALVAGLMLEVMLENPRLVEEAGSRAHHFKACLRSTLASHLAGRIPLSSFHSLAQGLDRWFEVFYPLLARAALGRHRPPLLAPSTPLKRESLLREDLLGECLEKTPGLLPRRRHRKLDRAKLYKFLEHTGGGWFRLRDFEEHFQVDRKTAWEYVKKLLQAGLLVHNQGHSSAVRYRVASCFLEVSGKSQVNQAAPPGPKPAPSVGWSMPLFR